MCFNFLTVFNDFDIKRGWGVYSKQTRSRLLEPSVRYLRSLSVKFSVMLSKDYPNYQLTSTGPCSWPELSLTSLWPSSVLLCDDACSMMSGFPITHKYHELNGGHGRRNPPIALCVECRWQISIPFPKIFNFWSSCWRSACDSGNSAAILEMRLGAICLTSEGEKIDQISPIKRLSTTWIKILSTKVFSATMTGFLANTFIVTDEEAWFAKLTSQ